jgi:hypothetical protein
MEILEPFPPFKLIPTLGEPLPDQPKVRLLDINKKPV